MTGTVTANLALVVLVYSRTGSPLLSALVFTVVFVPHLVAGTLLSALVDRLPVRKLLVSCNLLSAALAVLMALPGTSVGALFALAFTQGLIEPVFLGARAATLPAVLSGPSYVPGRSLLRLVSQGTQVGGYAVGGVLLTVVSPSSLLLGYAGCLACSAALLRLGTRERMPECIPPAAPRPALLRDSVAGLVEILHITPLRRVLLLGWAVPALAVAPEALALPYAASLQAGTVGAGLLMTAIPLGTVSGEVLTTWLVSADRQTRLTAPAAILVFTPLLVFAVGPGLALAIPILVISGLGYAFHLGLDRMLLDAAPAALRARALSIQTTGLMFWQGLGFAAAGAAAELAHPTVVIPLAACCGLLAVVLLTSPSYRASRAQW
jgi:MFS family permease